MSENLRIQIDFDQLQEAASESGVTLEQSEQMWKRLAAQQPLAQPALASQV